MSKETQTVHAKTTTVLGQGLRTAAGVGILIMLGLAAMTATGCTGRGKYTADAQSVAKIKMEGLKSATECKMAEQAFFANDLQKALKHVDYSISLNGNVARSHVLRGRIMLEMGDLEGASGAFARAEVIDPQNVESEYYQGILAERIDRKEDALKHYMTASQLDANNPQYAVAAAEMMIEVGKVDEAEAFLLTHSSNFDHNAGIRQTLGHIALMKNEPAKAVTLFNEARLLAPDEQAIIEDLVRAQIATRQFAEAEYNLSRLLTGDANKTRRDLKHMRATCLTLLDRPVEAREVLVSLTTDQAGAADVEAWLELGQISYALRDNNRLKQCAARVIALAPQRADGYVLKSLAQRRSGDLQGAKQSIQAAISIERTSHELIVLGMIQQDLSETVAARQSFAEAVRLNPADTTAGRLLTAAENID